MRTSAQTNDIQKALSLFHTEMQPVKRANDVKMKGTSKAGKEYEVSYEYAPLELIQSQAQPLLSKNGLSVVQMLGHVNVEGLTPVITTRICHESGQFIESDWPIDLSGISKEQDRGSKITYNKRYAYTAALDIILQDEDSDAVGVPLQSKKELPKQTPQTVTHPSEYIIKFGKKYAGLKMGDLKDFEISGYIKYLEDGAKNNNKPLTGDAKDFVDYGNMVLALGGSDLNNEIPF